MLTQTELSRVESVGDNCELGLVLREHRNEVGGFFRWTLCPLGSATKIIGEDFEGVYNFESLVPHSKIMVRDLANGIAFHSQMLSDDSGGTLRFIKSDAERFAIYEAELGKIHHLIRKFRSRLQEKGVLYVVKKNNIDLDYSAVEKFKDTLIERAGHRDINVLWVRSARDAENIGRVERVSENIATGYVRRFAPYIGASDFEIDPWVSVLRSAIQAFSCGEGTISRS